MKNPALVNQPKFTSPISMPQKKKKEKGNGKGKGKGKGKGNLPYLKFRRRLRKDMFKK